LAIALNLLLPMAATSPAQTHPAGPYLQREADAAAIARYLGGKAMRVLTFVGYSGAGYDDPAALLAQAEAVLRTHSPQRTLVNIGATAVGIGAVYPLAKRLGFATLGIVSSQARVHQVPLSPAVDVVFFVPDATWGGRLPGSARLGRTRLSPTSAATVRFSHQVVALGGGDVARDEWLAARRAGRQVQFIAADMAHGAAIAKAQRQGQPEPRDFRGALHQALAALPR
jgi:hypothetical protein